MLKVVVFDSGWGGEMFADYLEQELKVVEVVRVIDWRQGAYANYTQTEICEMTEKALENYFGRVEVIVLASYVVTVAGMEWLKKRHPEQKFVGFDLELSKYLKRIKERRRVMLLTTELVRKSLGYAREKKRLEEKFELLEPRCEQWVKQVDDGEMTEAVARKELTGTGAVDVVLLYCTNFVDMRKIFERIYGWQVWVIDDFSRVFRNTCLALGLKGLDGRKKR